MGKKGTALITGVAALAAATAIVANKQHKMKAAGEPIKGYDVDEKVQQLQDKVEELKILADNATADSRENLKITIQNLKGDAINHSENLKRKAERGKSKLSSELIKLQMNFDVKKAEFEKEFEERKFESAKAREEAKALRMAADASALMDYALEMIEEATVASLEATELAEAYKEKYGEEIIFDQDDEEEEIEEENNIFDDDIDEDDIEDIDEDDVEE